MARLAATVCALLMPSLAGLAPLHSAEANPSFLNEVMPLLTKAGCNQGACHGKGAGQNGFRLSLRGYAPEQDYRWLTREFDGRRIDRVDPENSLLLRKATSRTPHEGGRLFGEDSEEFRLLHSWIRTGLAAPNPGDPRITKLELRPASKVLAKGEKLQLQALATFADGRTRDVTWLTKFESNDASRAQVTPSGQVQAIRNGTAAVRAMFLTEVAVVVLSIPYDREIDPSRYRVENNPVDTHTFAKLRELRIEPSDLCTDEEFIRRTMLDACGSLPTVAELKRFLADPDPKKRGKLVEAILKRPEFTDYWALQLGDLLQNRRERDHDVRGVKGVRAFHEWIRKQVSINRPWDSLARDVLTASGTTTETPAVGYYVVTVGEHRQAEKSEAAESVAQAFLGTRIGCARCHNHPLERYTQDDFYHFAAYFSRVKLDRKDPKKNGEATALLVSHPDPKQNEKPIGVTQPRTGMFMKPQPLDRTTSEIKASDDPRGPLAEWITNPANEAFAGAMVNRVWKHYLGMGLVEPVDDLRATNPPTNSELWKSLKQEFVSHGYDLRHLMRLILNSRTYQLSATTRPSNVTDDRFYSHYYARRLPAEVLLDAVCDATGVPERFEGYPLGTRAVQLPDPGASSYFLRTFGRSDRVTACTCERTADVSLPQVLHLIGGEAVTAKLADANGWLAKTLQAEKDNLVVLDTIFLRTVSRGATDEEKAAVLDVLKHDDRTEVFRDVLWAVLNSKEFVFNR